MENKQIKKEVFGLFLPQKKKEKTQHFGVHISPAKSEKTQKGVFLLYNVN